MLRTEDPDHTGASETVESPKLVIALLSLAKSTRGLTGVKLTELGFSNGQDEVLLALDEEKPVTVSVLADLVRVRPSTISKMLDRLVPKGLVERISHEWDSRMTMVRITPSGLDARSRLLVMRADLEADLMSSLSGDAEQTMRSLEQVAELLRTKLHQLR